MADPADVAAQRVLPRVDAADAATTVLRITADVWGDRKWVGSLNIPTPEDRLWSHLGLETSSIRLPVAEVREVGSGQSIDIMHTRVMPGEFWVYLNPPTVEINILTHGDRVCTLTKPCPGNTTWREWYRFLQDDEVISTNWDLQYVSKLTSPHQYRRVEDEELVTPGTFVMHLERHEESSEESSEEMQTDESERPADEALTTVLEMREVIMGRQTAVGRPAPPMVPFTGTAYRLSN
jgi:hypothetical protein